MAKKIYAKCTNIEGDCIVAKSGKLLDFPTGTSTEDLTCPECSEQLFEVKAPGPDMGTILKKVLLIALPILLLGGGAWYITAGEDTPKVPTTSASTTPGPTKPEPTKPEPTTPGPTTPEPTTSGPTTPEPTPPVSKFAAYGDTVPNSKHIVDCDVLFQIWDGKGGKLDQIKKLAGCDCGTEKVFASGYKYLIECENGGKRAKLISSN